MELALALLGRWSKMGRTRGPIDLKRVSLDSFFRSVAKSSGANAELITDCKDEWSDGFKFEKKCLLRYESIELLNYSTRTRKGGWMVPRHKSSRNQILALRCPGHPRWPVLWSRASARCCSPSPQPHRDRRSRCAGPALSIPPWYRPSRSRTRPLKIE